MLPGSSVMVAPMCRPAFHSGYSCLPSCFLSRCLSRKDSAPVNSRICERCASRSSRRLWIWLPALNLKDVGMLARFSIRRFDHQPFARQLPLQCLIHSQHADRFDLSGVQAFERFQAGILSRPTQHDRIERITLEGVAHIPGAVGYFLTLVECAGFLNLRGAFAMRGPARRAIDGFAVDLQ